MTTKKGKKTSPKAKSRKVAARATGKSAAILELLKREGGATLAELTTATGWQTHSVRGFLSAVVKKKMGLKLKSQKNANGERVYAVAF